MSSSISADYSPTSNYSYPTDVSLSPHPPVRSSQSYNAHATVQPPRLSSPHIFREIFASEAVGPQFRSPPRLPPLQEINFAETMQDVNRALQSANRAIQTAQEAFQSRQTPSSNVNRRRDVVDLTHSPPSPSQANHIFDHFGTRDQISHNPQLSNRAPYSSLNEPFYPRTASSTNLQPFLVEEDDPTSRYAGQSDSLAGARRRFEAHNSNHHRSYMTLPNMERTLMRSALPATRRREEGEEEEAIRRQRVAREQWERNQLRQQQREQLRLQNDRVSARSEQRTDYSGNENQQTRSHSRSQAANLVSGAALVPGSSSRQPQSSGSSSSQSSSSVESVDLTSVNNRVDLATALVQVQSTNSADDRTKASEKPRSAFTAYKCPICLESPRNATTTICGHLFCHECILETLKNSENMRREEAPPHRKVKGQCPVCRKELARKEDEGKQRTLVPLVIQLVSKKQMEELKRQEKKRQRESEKPSKGKGKGKEDLDDENIFDLSSEGEDNWGASGSSQKENKAKRIKLSASEELDEELFGAYTYNDEA